MILSNKLSIRKAMIDRRKSLSEEQFSKASKEIEQKIIDLPVFKEAQHIGYYLAAQKEVETREVIALAQKLDKKTYLPALNPKVPNHLLFYPHTLQDPVLINALKVMEPDIQRTDLPKNLTELDVVLVPLVAFDSKGGRLGRGAGCFDRTFAFKKNHAIRKPYLIGLGYEFQKLEHIPLEPWDVKMDWVVTEEATYRS